MKHVNSHIVSIHRLGTFLSRAQAKTSDTFFSSNKEGIGAYFESKNSHKIGSGLSLTEEAILLPSIIDTPADDRDFRKKVSEFFNELNTDVPADTGTELEIGLTTDNTKPLALPTNAADEKTGNMPLNIMDYIRYRHAKGHPYTAISKEHGEGDMTKRFYIFDKEALRAKKTTADNAKDAAMEIFLKVKKEPDQVRQMLTLLGDDIRNYINAKDKESAEEEALRTLMNAKPEEFKKIYDEDDLETRAWIESMIVTGVLKRTGKRIYDPEAEADKSEIGVTMDEAIFWFKDETNSGHVIALKARLQEANLKVPEKEHKRTVV